MTSQDTAKIAIFRKLVRCLTATTVLVPFVLPSVAGATVEFTPRLSIEQVFNNGTYSADENFQMFTQVGAGFDSAITSRRIQAGVNYTLFRRFKEVGSLRDETRHELTARVNADVIRNFLSVDASGLITRTNTDFAQPVSFNPDADNGNASDLYTFQVSPRITQAIGSLALASLDYELGYSNLGDRSSSFLSGFGPGLTGATALSETVTQNATAQLSSLRPTNLSWTLTGGYSREDSERLNRVYESYYGTLGLEYAIGRSISLLGSVGYRDLLSEQDSILFDDENNPILDEDGNLQIDPDDPINTVFDRQGMTWDVGFRYSPTRSLNLQVRGGRELGDTVFSGDLSYRMRNGVNISATYSESVETTGRLLTRNIGGIPQSFLVDQNFVIGPSGCVFGVLGNGACILGATQSLDDATFRARQGQFTVSYGTGRSTYRVGGVYFRRGLLDVEDTPTPGDEGAAIIGDDRSLSAFLSYDYIIGRRQNAGARLFWTDSENNARLNNIGNTTTYGVTGSYNYTLSRGLNARARTYVARNEGQFDSRTELSLTLGLIYSF